MPVNYTYELRAQGAERRDDGRIPVLPLSFCLALSHSRPADCNYGDAFHYCHKLKKKRERATARVSAARKKGERANKTLKQITRMSHPYAGGKGEGGRSIGKPRKVFGKHRGVEFSLSLTLSLSLSADFACSFAVSVSRATLTRLFENSDVPRIQSTF